MNPFKLFTLWLAPGIPPPGPFGMSEEDEIKTSVANLVQRARQGDQNAMAQIAMVGKNAKKGNKRAQFTAKELQEYIDSNPPVSRMGKEVDRTPVFRSLKNGVKSNKYCTAILTLCPRVGTNKDDMRACCVIIAGGPPLNNHRIKSLGAAFGDDAPLFYHGVKHHNDSKEISTFAADIEPEAKKVLHTGCCVGMARSLQLVRMDDTPITPYCADAGWELGE